MLNYDIKEVSKEMLCPCPAATAAEASSSNYHKDINALLANKAVHWTICILINIWRLFCLKFSDAHHHHATVWPVKIRQMSIKVAKNDLTRKIKDFHTFTKVALECGRFGQTNCCHRLWKVAQIPINRPIWSHWPPPPNQDRNVS